MIHFGYFSFSTIHLELKRQIRLYAPVVPLKTIPDLRPKRLKNRTLWGGTYLYSSYKGVPPPPPPGRGLLLLSDDDERVSKKLSWNVLLTVNTKITMNINTTPILIQNVITLLQ